MRSNPHVIEINIRRWIRRLRDKYKAPLTLATIPDQEWRELKSLGFDAVWLMGAWQTGQASRAASLADTALRKKIEAVCPNCSPDDIGAHPYAISEHCLDAELGKKEELLIVKEKLNDMGMKLFLDYATNHLAIDHPMVAACPSCFIHAKWADAQYHPDWFFKVGEDDYIAYGRDPNFPPWNDVAQLNHFSPETRRLLIDTLLKISDLCDGVRCDVAMLSLNDVHEDSWGWLLKKGGFEKPKTEFWQDAIKAVKEKNPNFTFLAEVYWGLEWRVQEMGFDYTYDKVLYDRLRQLKAQDVKGHLRAEKLYQKRSIRFTENHDEQPSIVAFGRDKSLAAAVVIATLRGMRLFYYTQLIGMPIDLSVQCFRYDFPTDPAIYQAYSKLLKIADHPAFHGGEWSMVEPRSVSSEDSTHNNFMCWTWLQKRSFKIVIINYSPVVSRCRVPINAAPQGDSYIFYDELSELFYTRSAAEIKSQGLYVELPPYGAHILDLEF